MVYLYMLYVSFPKEILLDHHVIDQRHLESCPGMLLLSRCESDIRQSPASSYTDKLDKPGSVNNFFFFSSKRLYLLKKKLRMEF